MTTETLALIKCRPQRRVDHALGHADVLAQRRHGEMAGLDLFCSPADDDPQHRRADRADAVFHQARLAQPHQVDRPWLHALRSLLFAVDASAFYFAVAYMPLADAMTYWLAAPIYVAAASPFLLGEKVGWRRWTAILIGFAGVIIALEPSAKSFSLPALIALVGSAAFAFALLLGRTLRSTPDTTLIFWQLSGALIFSLVGVGANTAGWAPLDMQALFALSLLGIVAMMAHLLVSRSLKLADAATVVPLQLYASVLGCGLRLDVLRRIRRAGPCSSARR